MNKYHYSKIYKITNTIDAQFYIGSTTMSLLKRWHAHKHVATSRDPMYANRPVSVHMKLVGFGNCDIELIEDYKCESLIELRKQEQHWINTLHPELNAKRALLTVEEKHTQHLESSRKYTANNKEKLRAKGRAYYQKNAEKECLRFANFRECQRAIKIDCGCGVQHAVLSTPVHLKSKHHTSWVAAQNPPIIPQVVANQVLTFFYTP